MFFLISANRERYNPKRKYAYLSLSSQIKHICHRHRHRHRRWNSGDSFSLRISFSARVLAACDNNTRMRPTVSNTKVLSANWNVVIYTVSCVYVFNENGNGLGKSGVQRVCVCVYVPCSSVCTAVLCQKRCTVNVFGCLRCWFHWLLWKVVSAAFFY